MNLLQEEARFDVIDKELENKVNKDLSRLYDLDILDYTGEQDRAILDYTGG